MSVLFETSLGDLVIDLETELCPKTCENFLKLCKIYYYNFCSFFNVQKDYIAQTGDPSDLGTGGQSIYSQVKTSNQDLCQKNRYFLAELNSQKLHNKILNHDHYGTLSMAVSEGKCASQFFFTLANGLDDLNGKHVAFGRVVEGLETLEKINDALVDDQGRPLRDIRLRHVIVLDDPFDDPAGIIVPPQSPIESSSIGLNQILRVGDDEELDEDLDPLTIEERKRERDARAQALTLEMVGDLPFAEVAPPENILFVCKLNSITRSEDLELIFSRFGTILSCEVIKDSKTGDSLQYAFIEFDKKEDAERAYFKMDGVLIDDRRIHVDFSQSVSKLHADWVFKRTGRKMAQNSTDSHKRPRMPRQNDRNERGHEADGEPRRVKHKGSSKYEMSFDEGDLVDRMERRSKDEDAESKSYNRSRFPKEHSYHHSSSRHHSNSRRRRHSPSPTRRR
ncbi:hypothetical protein O181_007627 [Austropuccinia psidii MF-1]|uniref:Peptidyl-prolyl cis-trans isomerase n=1 Tax=Austropuccinia psidii MF-1 TaxID=1389203 RepID=A0A9Q3BN53_9BASI|nr:hypothetical protein [Austropuccinia psidii MF-1]